MKYLIIFIYLAINVLFFVFNMELFTTYLDFDFGFGSFSTLPLVILQAFGFITLVTYMLWDRMKDLKRNVVIASLEKQVVEVQKDFEIQQLKNDVKNLVNSENKTTIVVAEPENTTTVI